MCLCLVILFTSVFILYIILLTSCLIFTTCHDPIKREREREREREPVHSIGIAGETVRGIALRQLRDWTDEEQRSQSCNNKH